MKSKFVNRVIVGTLIASIPVGLLCRSQILSVILGAIWGCANLFVLKHLVLKLLNPNKKEYLKIALLALLKCPLLYGAGYVVLKVPRLSPMHLFIGFSLLFAMMALMSFKVTLLKRPRNLA